MLHGCVYMQDDITWVINTCVYLYLLQNFMVICTQRDSGLAQDFVRTLQKVGPPMGIRVGQPNL